MTLTISILSGLLNAGSALARPTEELGGPKLRIAVVDLSGGGSRFQTGYMPNNGPGSDPFSSAGQIGLPMDVCRGLTEMLTTALVKTGRFVVLERSALQQITGEQDFAASERANRETASPRNSMTGAQTLITGDITEFCYERSSVGAGVNFGGFSTKVGRSIAAVALHIRVIDVATGEVIFTDRFKGTASTTEVTSDLQQAATLAAKTSKPLAHASQKAVDKAVAALSSKLERTEWVGRVVDVRGKDVYVNAGSEANIRVGMRFEVLDRQDALVDPDTGRNLGAPEKRMGTISIVSVEERYSIARFIEGDGAKRGSVLRSTQHLARNN